MTSIYLSPYNIYGNNLVWHQHAVTRSDRESINGHKGALLWFTGLSGSGKSTVAGALETALHARRISTYLLDGDNLRYGLSRDLGFSDDDRIEHIRRVSEVSKMMVDAGLIVLTACISPYRDERQKIRKMFDFKSFIEVFIDTPLEICEARDPKGLYKKSRAGEIKNFTGIDAVFEKPHHPDIHLNGQELLNNLITKLLYALRDKTIIEI